MAVQNACLIANKRS